MKTSTQMDLDDLRVNVKGTFFHLPRPILGNLSPG